MSRPRSSVPRLARREASSPRAGLERGASNRGCSVSRGRPRWGIASSAWLAGSLGLTLACGAALPAPDIDLYPSTPSDDGCGPAYTRLEQLDEPSALGFSAVDVLVRLAGQRSLPLYWLEPASNQEYVLELGPERGRSTLELDVLAGEGPVLHRFRAPLPLAPEDTTCDEGALEIPVTVALKSAAQGLSESFDAVLEARTPFRGRVRKSLEPASLQGGLGVASVSSLDRERSFRIESVLLDAELWEGGSQGSLSLQLGSSHVRESKELRPPAALPMQPGSVAVWPSLQPCDGEGESSLPVAARVLGFSVNDVLEELQRGGPRQLTWSDGSTTPVQLELGAEELELCQEVGASLRFAVMLRARSNDGSFDVRLPVQVDAVDAGGSIGEITIMSSQPEVPYAVSEQANGAGSAFAADDYRAVLVSIEWTHAGAHDTGSLSLRGVDAALPDRSGSYPSTAIDSGRW